MRCCKALRRVFGLVAAFAWTGAVCPGAEPLSAAEPFTYLYDAPEASSVPLSDERLSAKSGWSMVDSASGCPRTIAR